jgi:TetR/AcrR family transcriptional regulator
MPSKREALPTDPATVPSRRDRILAIASDEFAIHGFAGVRIDRIAELAGLSKQLIYYHFNSKSGLYDAVFEQMVELTRPHWAVITTGSYRDSMLEQIDWNARDIYSRRWVRLLVMDELTVADMGLAETRNETERRQVWHRSVEFIRSRQTAGEIDGEFDPQMIALMSRVVFSMQHIVPQVSRTIVGQQPTDLEFVARFRRFILDVVKRMRPGEGPSRSSSEPNPQDGRRSRGVHRPKSAVPSATLDRPTVSRRDRVLRAAVEEFATRGFAAARIDSIAELSGCNKQLIYYYFKNKLGLYHDVLRYMMVVARPGWLPTDSVDFRDWIGLQIANAALPESYRWLRLLVMEGLEDGNQQADAQLPQHEPEYREIWHEMGDLAENAQLTGQLDIEFEPQMVALTFVLMSIAPRILPRMTMLFTDLAPDDPEFVRRYSNTLQMLLDRMGPRVPTA